MMRCKSRSGFALLSMLMALAIIAILMGMQFGPLGGPPTPGGGKPWNIQQIDRTRTLVTSMNTGAVQANYVMWQMDHPGRKTARDLQAFAQQQSAGGMGGKFFVWNDTVYNTIALDTPRNAELLGID